MYKKINLTLLIISAGILLFFTYKFYAALDFKLIAAEKVLHLENAMNNLNLFGTIIILVSWVWTNLFIIKTKQRYWLWMPFFSIVYVLIALGIMTEDIFKFKKDNGMWDGSFSLGLIASFVFIVLAAIGITINYFILRAVNNRKTKI